MQDINRRGFLAAGAAAVPAAALAARPAPALQDRVEADLDRYIGFGNKQAGGAGDMACGAWLAAELETVGFRIERQPISVPFFEPKRAELLCGGAKAEIWPQPLVIVTGPDGLTGPLVRVDANGLATASLQGAIALVDLPFGRWSTSLAKPIHQPIASAFAGGAKAAIAITNGPTGKIIALNADGRTPGFAGPVALLAPKDAPPFLAAAAVGTTATVHIDGTIGHRPAFNFVGRIDRGRKKWLAVSTPRSGWFDCAGERGPGIAIWLRLARWASRAVSNHDLAFVCNTGHEYENLGAAQSLKAIAPKPAETRLWLHLGANAGARDWHEGTGQPLPSLDPQRFLSVSPALLPLARQAFSGHVGLEAPYSSETLSAGELNEVIAAGYSPVAGVFGVHRFHHVAEDDRRCVSPASIDTTATAFQTFLERFLV